MAAECDCIGRIRSRSFLLVAAGLLFKSFDFLQGVDLGLNPSNLLTMRFTLAIEHTQVMPRRRSFSSSSSLAFAAFRVFRQRALSPGCPSPGNT